MNARWLIAALALFVCGCPKKTPEQVPQTDAGNPDAAPAPSAAASIKLIEGPPDSGINPYEIVSRIKSRKDPLYPTLSIWEKLSVERQDRPNVVLTAEKFYDGLTSTQGIAVTNRRQVLAQTVLAGYCLKADAAPDLDLVVCEFDDPATLEAGKKKMLEFPYKTRSIVSWKNSTVSIGRLSEAQPTTDAAKKIAAYVKTF